MKSITVQEIITGMTPYEVYKCILEGETEGLKIFPKGYITKDTSKEILLGIIHEKKWNREDICNNLTARYLRTHKLCKVYEFYNCNIYSLISDICSGMFYDKNSSGKKEELEIMPWELKECPNDYWNKVDNREKVGLWLQQVFNISTAEEFIKRFSRNDLERIFGLRRCIEKSDGYTKFLEEIIETSA